jgi:hypothetical protein
MRRIAFWLFLIAVISTVAVIVSPPRRSSRFKHQKDCVGCVENHIPAMDLGEIAEEQ